MQDPVTGLRSSSSFITPERRGVRLFYARLLHVKDKSVIMEDI